MELGIQSHKSLVIARRKKSPFVITMASGGLSKAVKATMGRAMRETGAALKEASGAEVRLIFRRLTFAARGTNMMASILVCFH